MRWIWYGPEASSRSSSTTGFYGRLQSFVSKGRLKLGVAGPGRASNDGNDVKRLHVTPVVR